MGCVHFGVCQGYEVLATPLTNIQRVAFCPLGGLLKASRPCPRGERKKRKEYAIGVLGPMHEGTRSSNHGKKPRLKFES